MTSQRASSDLARDAGRASEKAREAAEKECARLLNDRIDGKDAAGEALDAAHDPALGLDRSVCLRDVLDVLERAYHPQNPSDAHPRDLIEREFGGRESCSTCKDVGEVEQMIPGQTGQPVWGIGPCPDCGGRDGRSDASRRATSATRAATPRRSPKTGHAPWCVL